MKMKTALTFLFSYCYYKVFGFSRGFFHERTSSYPQRFVTRMSTGPYGLDIKLNGVEIKNFGGLRGIVATNDIDEKTAIVTVSSDATIETINNRPPTPYPEICVQSLWEESLWDNRLAFMLMYERFILGNRSPKALWIDALPKEFSTPLHWKSEDIDLAQYDELRNRVIKQREEWKAFYLKWQNAMKPVQSEKASCISYEQFEWAMECVNSRAFSGVYEGSKSSERRNLILFTILLAGAWPALNLGTLEQSLSAAVVVGFSILARDLFSSRISGLKRYVICPFVDMFNHKSDCSSDVSFNYFSGQLELRTQPYKQGEQIFISYGRQSNDRFLQYYGFVEADNPVDSYDFGKGIIEILLKYGDQLSEQGLLQSEPSPSTRLKILAQTLTVTPVQEASVPGRRSRSIPAIDSHLRCFRSTITDAASKSDKKVSSPSSSVDGILSLAKARREAKQSSDQYTPGTGTAINSKVDDVSVRVLRAMSCSREEWSRLTKNQNSISLEELSSTLSVDTELRLANSLRAIIKLELDSKPTTLVEDRELLEKNLASIGALRSIADVRSEGNPSGDFSEPFLCALAFRIEKKQLLLETLIF